MKIVHLLTYLDSQTGGMERQALQLAKRLSNIGHEIFFITCAHRDKMKKEQLRAVDTIDGLKIYRLPFFSGRKFLNAMIFFVGALYYLVRLRKRYDIIHAHQLWTSGITACFAKTLLPKKKLIIKNCSGGEIGDIQQMKKFPLSGVFLKCMKRQTDAFIAVSNETSEEMRGVGLRCVEMIPNGVATDIFVPLEIGMKLRFKKDLLPQYVEKQIILFVGRLFPKKRVSVLLNAIRLLDKDVVLVIIGDGPLRFQLEKEAQALHLEEQVLFLGAQKDVYRYYQIADIFVLPSRNEGMPNALLEAMSCGVPSVGSDIASITAIITHGHNGFIFELDNDKQLAQQLGLALKDNALRARISQNSRKTIESRFSFASVVQRYATLYEQI